MQTDINNPTGDVIDPEDIKPLDTKLTAIIVILVVLLVILVYYLIDSNLNRATGGQTSVGTLTSSMITPIKHINGTSSSKLWTNLTAVAFPLTLVIMIIYFFCMGALHNMTHNKFRSDRPSVDTLLMQRRSILGQRIEGLIQVDRSVCSNLINSVNPYKLIVSGKGTCLDERALVNWRPLTVRLTGYLGGIDTNNPSLDGVFDMDNGVRHALHLGARGFLFDIGYLDAAPCEPCIIFRDDSGIKRSLNEGSIKDGMQALASYSFRSNTDPVLVILYLRKIPAGENQRNKFFKKIATALDPLAQNHLGLTDNGNFHKCLSESSLFHNPITIYQKKFIVLVNYNTADIVNTSRNPKDNLHYWTNARIYEDPAGPGSALGAVTTTAPTAPAAVAHVGLASQIININTTTGSKEMTNYLTSSRDVFKIVISSPDYKYSMRDLNKLLNELGVQCIPLDVLNLGITRTHANDTLKNYMSIPNDTTRAGLSDKLSKYTNANDLLSFWTYAGWSWKYLPECKEGFQNYKEGFEETAPIQPIKPIQGFLIQKPVVPKKPSSTMNSNGGLVNVA